MNKPKPIMSSQTSNIVYQIQEKLKTVYDPEFPMVDIYTLGLIYNIDCDDAKKTVHILMTFTTPFCPMAETIQQMVRNAILEIVPMYTVEITVTFDPPRNHNMIRDKDLQRMFQ